MPAWQKPDPAIEIAKLKREVEELGRTVRRGKPVPHMREMADADLAKVTDGEVPVYDSATGTFKPGAPGGSFIVLSNWDPFTVPSVEPNTMPVSARVPWPEVEIQSGGAFSWSASDPTVVRVVRAGYVRFQATARIDADAAATGDTICWTELQNSRHFTYTHRAPNRSTTVGFDVVKRSNANEPFRLALAHTGPSSVSSDRIQFSMTRLSGL